MISVLITSELCSTSKNFQEDITMAQLCDKLYLITGVLPQDMELEFKSSDKTFGTKYTEQIENETPLLIYKPLKSINVKDTNTHSVTTQLAKDQDVESFQLSESDYAKRHDTVLNWKIQNKLGRFDSEYQIRIQRERDQTQKHLETLEIDQRCTVQLKSQPEKRGWLRYLGRVVEINPDDTWCGVEFDEPVGKNNGTFGGHLYFGPVLPNYGSFVKPLNVKTGPQYTPFSIGIDSAEEDEDEV